MKVEVSVIVPNYNHARYLKQRIDSILNQTFQEFELILMDDCSSDNSLEILEEYRNHPNVAEIIINLENSGSTFKQWEKGIKVAKGRFVWIAESDDWAEADFLARAYQLLSNNKRLAFVSSNSNWVDENGKFLSKCTHACFQKDNDYVMAGMEFFERFMTIGNSISNASAVLFRKDSVSFSLDEIRKYRLCGDWVFWSRLMMNNEVGIITDCLSNFRQHNKSVRDSIQKHKEKSEIIRALNYILENSYLQKPTKQKIFDNYYQTWKLDGFEREYLQNATYDSKIWNRRWKFWKYQLLKWASQKLKKR
ncbi:MAG: glycosyltransferase [Cytophagales bacterium]